MEENKTICPCKRTKCERHGNCSACLEHHKEINSSAACERIKIKEELKAKRSERKMH